MITETRIDAIQCMLQREGVNERAVSGLRRAYTDMHFTYCLEDDIGEMTPFTEADEYNLYLIDGHDHCLSFTRDQEKATGLVIAEKIDD